MSLFMKTPNNDRSGRPSQLSFVGPIVLTALVILGCLSATARAQCPDASGCTQTMAITSNGRFKVTFVGVTCSGGNSTWCYEVTWTGQGNALSHITFGVCGDLTSSNIVGATIDGTPATNIEFGLDPTTGVFGIKFDSPGALTPNVPKRFCFTINRTDLSVAPLSTGLKPGPDEFLVTVCGPECPQRPTTARLSSFSAKRFKDGRVEINWETGFEANNLGFNIYRDNGKSRTLITPDLVAGSAFLAAPGLALQAGLSYSWSDSLPRKARNVQYWLEDFDLNGDSSLHGPFAVELSDSLPDNSSAKTSPLLSRLADSTHSPSSSAPVVVSAALPLSSTSLLTAGPNLASMPAAKIAVKQAGWYRIAQPSLTSAGISPSADPRNLQLFVNGQQLPIIVRGESDGRFDPTDSVEFFGVGLDSQFSSGRIYWLVSGSQPGRRISSLSTSNSAPLSSTGFSFTVERRDKVFFFSSLLNGEQENFFGPVISSSIVSQSLSLTNIDFSSATDATIDISLQGVTLAPHQVSVSLNDQPLGSISFTDRAKGSLSISVPHSILLEGANTVKFARQAGSTDVSVVESVRITYQHSFKADSDSLFVSAPTGQQLTVSGFSSSSVQAFDVTNPDNPAKLATSTRPDSTGGFSVSITSSGGGDRKLFIVADSQARQADSIVANAVSNLRSTSNAANLVIITRSDLISSLATLKSYRQNRGLSVSLVDVVDIYDEFAFGHKTPFAIRDFLQFTQSWKKAPRFALLAGDGTYDPKDYVGGGAADLVPIKLVETPTMETASDDWYVDFNNDVLAEMAIGRLPVRTPADVSVMVGKIITYEQSAQTAGALLVSDAHDGLFDFEAATAEVKSLIPATERVDEIYRGQLGDVIARARLLEGINLGPKVVNYIGHGTLTNWNGNILTANDAATLVNEKNPTLLVSMTCLNGLFHNPTGNSLAEAMISAKGGAVAAWASSGLTGPRNQAAMNHEIVRQLFTKRVATIGEATNRAKSVVLDHNVRRTWILFGDPTTRIK